MKKILFGSAAAVCAVAGLSSFKQVNQSFVIHYFKVLSGNGLKSQFINGELTSQGQIADNTGCNNGIYRCVVGFTENQVTYTSLGSTILANTVAARQTIAVTAFTKAQDN